MKFFDDKEMSNQKEDITKIVYDAIDEINSELINKRIEKSLNSAIYGTKDLLDSFELVNFIVSIEEKVEEHLSKILDLTDDKAISQDYTPFADVKTLVDFIATRINEKPDG